jgi:hypothetical protein
VTGVQTCALPISGSRGGRGKHGGGRAASGDGQGYDSVRDIVACMVAGMGIHVAGRDYAICVPVEEGGAGQRYLLLQFLME